MANKNNNMIFDPVSGDYIKVQKPLNGLGSYTPGNAHWPSNVQKPFSQFTSDYNLGYKPSLGSQPNGLNLNPKNGYLNQQAKSLDFNGKLGLANTAIGAVTSVANLGLGIYNAVESTKLAKKQYELAKEQFGLEKAMANRNLFNQAQLVNREVANASQMAGLYGATANSGNYANIKQNFYDRNKVNGNPIG